MPSTPPILALLCAPERRIGVAPPAPAGFVASDGVGLRRDVVVDVATADAVTCCRAEGGCARGPGQPHPRVRAPPSEGLRSMGSPLRARRASAMRWLSGSPTPDGWSCGRHGMTSEKDLGTSGTSLIACPERGLLPERVRHRSGPSVAAGASRARWFASRGALRDRPAHPDRPLQHSRRHARRRRSRRRWCLRSPARAEQPLGPWAPRYPSGKAVLQMGLRHRSSLARRGTPHDTTSGLAGVPSPPGSGPRRRWRPGSLVLPLGLGDGGEGLVVRGLGSDADHVAGADVALASEDRFEGPV